MCGGGSGEGRGASEEKIQKGWMATPKERREHDKGYGERGARKPERREQDRWTHKGRPPRNTKWWM